MLTMRRAEIQDIPMIMQFLDDHWLKGYALAHNRELFDWQFVRNGKVNVWIGVDDDVHHMYAMEGAIIYSDSDKPDVSGCLWISTRSENPFLAYELALLMLKETNSQEEFGIGLLPKAAKIYKKLGEEVVTLDHYYRLGNKSEYLIAQIQKVEIPKVTDSKYQLIKLNTPDEMKKYISLNLLEECRPRKDYGYLIWRYYEHPIFQYEVWGIDDQRGEAKGAIVTREERSQESVALKIVDFYGQQDALGRITCALDSIIAQRGYEYADIYSYGIDTAVYEKSGFMKCDESSVNIIPNFFQPYTCINTEIYAKKPKASLIARFFRGDSDQDKPRLMIDIK